jgi:hypothetical protein
MDVLSPYLHVLVPDGANRMGGVSGDSIHAQIDTMLCLMMSYDCFAMHLPACRTIATCNALSLEYSSRRRHQVWKSPNLARWTMRRENTMWFKWSLNAGEHGGVEVVITPIIYFMHV